MQIALTRKLSAVMGVKPIDAIANVNPLFMWTANWTNTFDGHREDMLVMVNNATRFTVTIFGIRKNQFKKIESKMIAAIRNTFHALNINSEIVDEYFLQAGDIEFIANHDRRLTSYVANQCLVAALFIGEEINASYGKIKYDDTLGYLLNNLLVNCNNDQTGCFYPCEKMMEKLSKITDKPIYNYHAFEISVTLDLGVYSAVRRLIIPADIGFFRLHCVLRNAFNWKSAHLYDFTVLDVTSQKPLLRLTESVDATDCDMHTIALNEHKLSDFVNKNSFILYTCGIGELWEHRIEIIRDIANYNKESPYLIEAIGQTPPENVGGVNGYIEFYKIIHNPTHVDYEETKKWAGCWSFELNDWEKCPRALRR